MAEDLTHAGAVAFKGSGQDTRILVVSSSDGRYQVLPKGHIEPDESPEQCALRELGEEAGVTGELVAPLTRSEYDVDGEIVHVHYFLVHVDGTVAAKETRELSWLVPAQAIERLSFDDSRDAVRAAIAGLLP